MENRGLPARNAYGADGSSRLQALRALGFVPPRSAGPLLGSLRVLSWVSGITALLAMLYPTPRVGFRRFACVRSRLEDLWLTRCGSALLHHETTLVIAPLHCAWLLVSQWVA